MENGFWGRWESWFEVHTAGATWGHLIAILQIINSFKILFIIYHVPDNMLGSRDSITSKEIMFPDFSKGGDVQLRSSEWVRINKGKGRERKSDWNKVYVLYKAWGRLEHSKWWLSMTVQRQVLFNIALI